jgi:hypothetical protein
MLALWAWYHAFAEGASKKRIQRLTRGRDACPAPHCTNSFASQGVP